MARLTHVMLDLETWDTRPGCALRSVGAVLFDPRGGDTGDTFYANVSRESCEERSLKFDPLTIEWWGQQGEKAQKALLTDQQDVKDVLYSFHGWFENHEAEFVWSHGANFDEPIVTEAMLICGIKPPWKFWNVRCTRTLYDTLQFDPRSVPRGGTHHNALDDAVHQARCVQAAHARAAARTKRPAVNVKG